MNVIQRMGRWLLGAGSKAAQTGTDSQMIGVRPGEVTAGVEPTDALAYALNAWVYVCVNTISEAVSSAPLVVDRKVGKDWQPDEACPLYVLLDYVNSTEDQYTLIDQTAAWLALKGTAYWHLLRASSGAKPTALDVLPADLTTPVPGRGVQSPIIKGYKVDVGMGQEVEYPDNDVIQFKRFNPNSRVVGQSPIRVIETEINTYLRANRYNSAFLKGGGVPSGILSTDAMLTDDGKARNRGAWDEWSAQSKDKQRPLNIGGGMKYQAIGTAPDTVLISELPKQLRETICAVLNVPPVLVGLLDGATYANAEAQERKFYKGPVAGYWRRIETALNEQLATQFGPQYRCRFDRDSVAALQPNYLELSQAASTLTGGEPVLTVNEARERLFNLEPLVDAWGETRYGNFSTIPLVSTSGPVAQPEAPEVVAPAETPKARPGPAQTQQKASPRRLSSDGRVALWKARNLSRTGATRKVKQQVRTWFDGLEEEVLANVAAAEKAGLITRYKAPRVDALVFSVEGGSAELRRLVDPTLEAILEATGQEAVASLDGELRFDVQSPRALELLKQRSQEMKTVAQTAQDRCRASLAEGIANGETVEQLKERVREWANAGREGQAENVARTEAGVVMNGAALEGYRQGGAEGKEWLSIVDDRSREGHAELDGTVVGLDKAFTLSLEDGSTVECDGPGDPSLGPDAVCNCRCTVAPVVSL